MKKNRSAMILVAICIFPYCTEFVGNDSGDSSIGERRDESCTCFSPEEIMQQIDQLNCVHGIVRSGCNESPTLFAKDPEWFFCFDVIQSPGDSCYHPIKRNDCIECCGLPPLEVMDDYIESCANEPVVVFPLENDTASGHYSLFECSNDGAHGTVVESDSYGCSYTPDANYVGEDSFTYYVSDICAGSSRYSRIHITIEDCADAG